MSTYLTNLYTKPDFTLECIVACVLLRARAYVLAFVHKITNFAENNILSELFETIFTKIISQQFTYRKEGRKTVMTIGWKKKNELERNMK